MTLGEMEIQKRDIEKAIKTERERLSAVKRKEVSTKLDTMSEDEKNTILGFLKHDCSSCSDSNPCNGYVNSQYEPRCTKCHLIEIFNGEHGGEFDFHFYVSITRV